MAEGGGEFGYEDPELDNRLDHDSDSEQEVNTTQPFHLGVPDARSTPYHGGEQTAMSTFPHEQSGLPDTSHQEETLLLGRTLSISDLQKEGYLRQKLRKAVDTIKNQFDKANFEKLRIRRGTGKLKGKIVAVARGPKKRYRVQDSKRRRVRLNEKFYRKIQK